MPFAKNQRHMPFAKNQRHMPFAKKAGGGCGSKKSQRHMPFAKLSVSLGLSWMDARRLLPRMTGAGSSQGGYSAMVERRVARREIGIREYQHNVASSANWESAKPSPSDIRRNAPPRAGFEPKIGLRSTRR
jgi:hypothetical protein